MNDLVSGFDRAAIDIQFNKKATVGSNSKVVLCGSMVEGCTCWLLFCSEAPSGQFWILDGSEFDAIVVAKKP